jgi:PRTRC genetic system ThiF family protein
MSRPSVIAPNIHVLAPRLVQRDGAVRVLIVGCGGTGSVLLGQLPYLSQALVARGHAGLEVLVLDPDVVSDSNCVRQPFARSEVGQAKATVLVSRLNAFFGLSWLARVAPFTRELDLHSVDIIIGCVDSRAARAEIVAALARTDCVSYYLDCGNAADGGQVVLGEPRNAANRRNALRLRTVDELMPEIVDATLDADDTLPSCSALEALTRQAPGVNMVIAGAAANLLHRLLWNGHLAFQGAFVNLVTGQTAPIPLPVAPAATTREKKARRKPVKPTQRRARNGRRTSPGR